MSEEVAKLTWAVLLGRWIEFAQAAVALPNDDAGQRWRASVPDLIGLQAVWFALQHLDELDRPQQAVGLDRAAVLIEQHRANLEQRFGADLPPAVAELLQDALSQHEQAEARWQAG